MHVFIWGFEFMKMKGDPGFKLFGKTIPVSDEEDKCSGLEDECEDNNDIEAPEQVSDKETFQDNILKSEVEGPPDAIPEEAESVTGTNESREVIYEKPIQDSEKNIPLSKMENNIMKNGNGEEEAVDTNGNEEKMPKKPDKLLPCPRCDSLDTKFCYYNNYNVNQPRHFCKNCQRYWTAGGTMRNVPVGAGRRKNKHSTSHYRHMLMTEALGTARADCPDSAHHHVMPTAFPSTRVLKTSQIQLLPLEIESAGGTVLNFGPDAPLCESMATALNLADQPTTNRQAFSNKDDEKNQLTNKESIDDNSCGSSITVSNSVEKEDTTKNVHCAPQVDQIRVMGWSGGIPPQHPYYGAPWPYGWNFGWGDRAPVTAARGYPNGIPYAPDCSNVNTGASGAGLPGVWAAGFRWPFVPGPYWAGPPGWGGGTWNVPFPPLQSPTTGGVSSPSNSGVGCGSPSLGKHPRDVPSVECKRNGSLWVPKTLRVDEPGEAARSSIWTTLGIGDKCESIASGGMFKAFQSKTEDMDLARSSAQGLHANPAALSRSMAFQENSRVSFKTKTLFSLR